MMRPAVLVTALQVFSVWGHASVMAAVTDADPADAAGDRKALADLELEVAKAPAVADKHFARGRILSRMGRLDEAVAAYDQAGKLDPKRATAPYNAGTVLARLGRMKDAALRFDAALARDPKFADAAYNAGQAYYDVKDFGAALARFQRASDLVPRDFNTMKKVMQVQLALGRETDAWKTRDRVLRLWRESERPEVRSLNQYVLDQFDVKSLHIFAYETLRPTAEDRSVYTFQVTDGREKVHGSVSFEEGSADAPQGSPPFFVKVDRQGKVKRWPAGFNKVPRYSEVKGVATSVIVAEFEALSPGSSGSATLTLPDDQGACEKSNGLACYNLGKTYRLGDGVAIDLAKALALYAKACGLNEAKGCNELGLMYYDGDGVQKDRTKGIELMEKACRLGSQVACRNLQAFGMNGPFLPT